MNWTPELDAELSRMKVAGYTCPEIAKALGCSKYAVTGRWDRLNDGHKRRAKYGTAKGPPSIPSSMQVIDPYRADRRLRGGPERPWSWQVVP